MSCVVSKGNVSGNIGYGRRTFILGFVRFYSEDGPDGRYLIKSRTAVGFAETECHSAGGEFIPSGCTGSGWTFIGGVKGGNSTEVNSPIYIRRRLDVWGIKVPLNPMIFL